MHPAKIAFDQSTGYCKCWQLIMYLTEKWSYDGAYQRPQATLFYFFQPYPLQQIQWHARWPWRQGMESTPCAIRNQFKRADLKKHKIFNHYHTQTIQDQNKRWAIYVETGEQDCAAIHIFHLSCISNQGVGVTASPQTLIDPGTGLQLEVVYHATTLSGL